jgi:hypothetical protein
MFKSPNIFFKLLLIFFLFNTVASGQVKFVEGYIIKNGSKQKVFIKDLDWSNNPSDFSYKTNLKDNNIIVGNTSNIEEFGIGNYFRYISAKVQIDQSSSQVNKMTNYSEADFKSETVFLKQIIDGEAKLFSVQNNKFQRFFYRMGDGDIEPLVYKKYKLNESQISENVEFKLKLSEDLKCSNLNADDFRSLSYNNKSLSNIFYQYNTCVNSSSITYARIDNEKGYFNLAIKAGVFSLGLDVKEEGSGLALDVRSVNMGKQTSIRLAAEIEYLLPFNKNKWAIFLEPGYQKFTAFENVNIESLNQNLNQSLSVDYQYVDVPFGLRHYMYINDTNKLFISAALSFALDLSSSTFNYEGNLGVRDSNINSSANLVFGLGYNFNQKISIEARVNTARNITRDEAFLNSNFSSSGIILAYYFL